MKTYLGFSVVEYSVVFGAAIILGAAVNLYLTRLSDRKNKNTMLYFASAIFAAGLFGMYLAKGMDKTATLITFGIAGFVMITGYILISALCGSLVRDYTPEGVVGKLLGPDETLYHDVHTVVTNANRLLVNLDASAVRLRDGEGTVGRLLADDKLYRDLEESVASFKTTCESFNGKKVMESADRLLGNLNTVAERLRNGEGTIGKLIKDESMYREVEGLIKDVRQVIDNYRDTTPISTFTSLATGAL
jgi:hypothetical protein